jgi:hypothetical protein
MPRQQVIQIIILAFTSIVISSTNFGCANGIAQTVSLTGIYYPPSAKQSPYLTYGVSFTFYSFTNSILLVGKIQNITYDGTTTLADSSENSIPSNWAITGKCKLFIDYDGSSGNINAAGTVAQVFDNNGNNGTVYFFGTSITIAGLNGIFVLS